MSAEPIAIVGIGCRLPGGVENHADFWSLLIDGRDAILPIPANRMDVARYYDPMPGTAGKLASPLGGYLDEIERFDAAFFGIAPQDAERMDPQQRLLLELAWEALEDSGLDIERLAGSLTGVYAGQANSDYEHRLFSDAERMDFAMMLGSGRCTAAGRVSFALDLHGPSFTVDTACAASLTGVHLAVRALREGSCDLALAGGSNIILRPQFNIAYSGAGIAAADGRCKFGDDAADGFVRSEGAGMLVLRRLAEAQADGQRIHAVILGSVINNDGRGSRSFGSPSRVGQTEMLRAAYRDAGIEPGTVGYVEAHGTGTRVGDPVELRSLAAVMSEGRPADRPLLVGSVKTNMGHAEGAAGIIGLIKAALVVSHGAIPRSLHHVTPSRRVRWQDLNLRVVTETTPFASPRFAGVSAYGISGTNVHVVLGEPPTTPLETPSASSGPFLLPLSARSPAALRALATRYADRLTQDDGVHAADLVWGAATRRTALPHRAVFAAADAKSLAEQLGRFAAGEAEAATAEGVARGRKSPSVAFVMPGHGGQLAAMGRQLLATNRVFRETLTACDAAVQSVAGWSLLAQIEAGAPDIGRVSIAQPLICALSIAYAAVLRACGVTPAAVIGHSLGEVAAAHVAGVLDLAQAMRVVCRRSALIQAEAGRGAMALVDLSAAETATRLAGDPHGVVIAAMNGPRATVISGDADTIATLTDQWGRDGTLCRMIQTDVAFHSPQMDQAAAALGAELDDLAPAADTLPIYSTVAGGRLDGAALDASHWAANVRQPVRFLDAVQSMEADGLRCFVELGENPVLLGSLRQIVPDAVSLACGTRSQPAAMGLLAALGTLWIAGCKLDWGAVMPPGRWIDLPLYPWQRERYWSDVAALGHATAPAARQVRLSDAQQAWLYRLEWTQAEPRGASRAGAWLVLDAGAQSTASATTLAATLGADTAPIDRLKESLAGVSDIAVLVEDRPDASFVPSRVLQSALRAGANARLWFITQSGQAGSGQAVAAQERVSADLAACWGAARVVGEEHPDLWGGLADIGPGDEAALGQHLLQNDGEDQVAFRGNRRFVLRLQPSEAQSAPYVWREDGTYLITGGLGGVGLQMARCAVQAGARRLLLLGRTPLPPRETWGDYPADAPQAGRIAAIRALEARGVAVQTESADVADEASIRGVLALHRAQGLPPICGVIHAAAENVTMLARDSDPASFERGLTSKLRGAQVLDRALPDVELFVMVSSATAIIPHPGIAAYAAANAGLDAIAQDRRARGLTGLSIGWGLWETIGLTSADVGAHVAQEMARIGVRALPAAKAGEAFLALCGANLSYQAVLDIDWDAYKRARPGRSQTVFSDRYNGSSTDSGGLAGSLADTPAPARAALIEALVRKCVGQVLRLAPERLDAEAALGDFGLTSLMAIELCHRLEQAAGCPVPATLAWNYPSIKAIGVYLDRTLAPKAAAAAPASATPSETIEVDIMSDEQALEILMGARV